MIPDLPTIEGVQTGISVNQESPPKVNEHRWDEALFGFPSLTPPPLLLLLLLRRLGRVRSKMATQSLRSLGTKTTCRCSRHRKVSWIISTNVPLKCLMRFNGFSLIPSLCVCVRVCVPGVKIVPSITLESTSLFSVKSELNMMVVKENKDDKFYCEVNYPAPGGEIRMTETDRINVTVYCEFFGLFETDRSWFSQLVRLTLR